MVQNRTGAERVPRSSEADTFSARPAQEEPTDEHGLVGRLDSAAAAGWMEQRSVSHCVALMILPRETAHWRPRARRGRTRQPRRTGRRGGGSGAVAAMGSARGLLTRCRCLCAQRTRVGSCGGQHPPAAVDQIAPCSKDLRSALLVRHGWDRRHRLGSRPATGVIGPTISRATLCRSPALRYHQAESLFLGLFRESCG